MPISIMSSRRRQLKIARPRQPSQPWFVTLRIYATVYRLDYPAHPETPTFFVPYSSPYPKAFGYVDRPPPTYPLKPIGPVVSLATVPVIPTPPPPPPPPPIPAGRGPLGPPFLPGDAFVFVPGILPSRIVTAKFEIAQLTILADLANAFPIWVKYARDVGVNSGFPLLPGAARDCNINDLSMIWFLAQNATDRVFYIYET